MINYIILGYGIPKNILKDEHYNHYLKTAFNRIFDESAHKEARILFSGGPTDIQKPFRRIEALEMKKLFDTFAQRSFVRKATKQWKYLLEKKSLSTLGNILYSHKILRSKVKRGTVVVICEFTRSPRITKLTKKIFGKNYSTKILPVDFDVSLNRYDTKLIKEKEAKGLKLDLWALKKPENFKRYNKLSMRRLADFRAKGPARQPETIKKWWEKELKELTLS